MSITLSRLKLGQTGTQKHLNAVIAAIETALNTLAPSASPTFTGTVTMPAEAVSLQALSGAGAVDVVTRATRLTTTGASQALTLADGVPGQIKSIVHEVDGGSAILTPTTKTGFTTITFTNVGDSCGLMFFATRGWMILSLNGAVAA